MNSLVHPMFMHLVLCVFLYALLTVARAPDIWGLGKKLDGSNPFEPIKEKMSANLRNQFEWPVFFHIVCLLLMIKGLDSNALYTLLAWVFVLGRFIHSVVQILTSSVRLRGLVFTINFIAVLIMWCLFLIDITAT